MKRLLLVLVLTAFAFTSSPVGAMNNTSQVSQKNNDVDWEDAEVVNEKFYLAAKRDNLTLLKQIINTPERCDVLRAACINAVFFLICKKGLASVATLLINNNTIISKISGYYKDMSFLAACWDGHRNIIKLFIETPQLFDYVPKKSIRCGFMHACRAKEAGIAVVALYSETSELFNKLTEENINDAFELVCSHDCAKVAWLFINMRKLIDKLTEKGIRQAVETAIYRASHKVKRLFKTYLDGKD